MYSSCSRESFAAALLRTYGTFDLHFCGLLLETKRKEKRKKGYLKIYICLLPWELYTSLSEAPVSIVPNHAQFSVSVKARFSSSPMTIFSNQVVVLVTATNPETYGCRRQAKSKTIVKQNLMSAYVSDSPNKTCLLSAKQSIAPNPRIIIQRSKAVLSCSCFFSFSAFGV